MKFIGSNGGRCTRLFSWEEIRPTHGITPSLLAAVVTERFQFQVRPPHPVPQDTLLKFADGSVVIDGTLIPFMKLDVYSDGYAVECNNTDDAKLVSDELLKWAQTDLGFRDFVRPPQVVYQSQVLVEFDPGFENIFRSWKKIQSLLNASTQERYGFSGSVDVLRLHWRGDSHTIVNNNLVSDFWIERKVTESHSSNRWICTGVLPLNDWLDLLEAIEALAISS